MTAVSDNAPLKPYMKSTPVPKVIPDVLIETEDWPEGLEKMPRCCRERLKELNCLYSISKIVERYGNDIDDTLQEIVKTIPPAWQYPRATCAGISIEGKKYTTSNFRETERVQRASIMIHGQVVGCIEVYYLGKDAAHNDPFLKEEAHLISAIAERLGRIIERIQSEKSLQEKTKHLEEANIALKVLLKQKDHDRSALGENVIFNIKEMIAPYLCKLDASSLNRRLKTYIEIIESNLANIITPFARNLSSKCHNLTPMEIKVAGLVRDGKSNKDMADILNVSTSTILTHRHHIRSKLGLRNKKVNLRSHLNSLKQY